MFAYVGETLRRLRKERGKTLEELGQEAGLGRGQLSRIENSRQEATLTTLSKILHSQGMSRRDFFHRYELVETEAEAVERSGAVPAASGTEGGGEWPEEAREILKRVESFVSAAFLQPRPVAQGTFELGNLVVLFRVISKDQPQGPTQGPKDRQDSEETPETASSEEARPAVSKPASPPSGPPSRRPAHRRKRR